MKIKKFNEFLNEKSIAKLAKPVEIRITVDKTFHALKRQTREENEDNRPVTDEELIRACDLSIEQLTIFLMQDLMDIENPFIICDLENNIEMACKLDSGLNNFTLKVITCIRGTLFKGKDQMVINV